MKKWMVIEPDSLGNPYSWEMTEDEIVEEFWDWWLARMVKKYGEGHDLITRENCIQDWIAIH